MTFRFEAEIAIVFEGIPFDSGIDLAVGDIVTGRFSFEPSVGDATEISYSTVQPYAAAININGASFLTPSTISNLETISLNDAIAIDYPPRYGD